MRSIDGGAGRRAKTWGRIALATGATSLVALTLSACGTEEYPGEFTVQNGDSSISVGEEYRYDSVTALCREQGGQITLTLTAQDSGNTFTTTQPESGSGYAGGTLTIADSGEEYTWVPLDGITDEDIRGDAQIFENEAQSGSPAIWSEDGSVDIEVGLRQSTTNNEDGSVRVDAQGRIVCDGAD